MSETARLRLIKQFKCLADDCPDTCCDEWDITLDRQTNEKWHGIKKQSQRDLLLNAVRTSPGNPSEQILLRKENGRCVHLDEDGLCEIQRELSHTYLPQACQSYPREQITKNTLHFETAHLSCPAIVRLMSKSPIDKLIEDEESLYQPQNLDIISQLSCAVHKYMQNIFSIKEIYLGLKVYALSTVLADILKMALEDTLTSDLLNRKYHVSADELAGQWIAWQKLSHTREFDEKKMQIREFLQKVDASILAKYREDYARRLDVQLPTLGLTRFFKWRAGIDISGLDTFFEKYLRIKFLNAGFPWNPMQNNHTATFLECVVSLLICHYILIAYHEAGRQIDQLELEKIVYTVEKINGHSNDVARLIRQKPDLQDMSQYNLIFTLFV